MSKAITYKTSGVDIQRANTFVRNIQTMMDATMSASVLKKQKAFGSFFALDMK